MASTFIYEHYFISYDFNPQYIIKPGPWHIQQLRQRSDCILYPVEGPFLVYPVIQYLIQSSIFTGWLFFLLITL